MKVKLNSSENYEHLCTVKLTKEKYPIAYENKVLELMEDCNMSEAEAEALIKDMAIELEIYYHKGYGLFAVESEAVESCTIYSPYSGELCEDADCDA